jgi:hypothetical protein
MVHYVPLKKFPSELEIPEPVKDRFWYDDDRECLAFDGPMWKSTFDRLRCLCWDFHYQRALEELFRIAVPEDHTAQQRRRWPGVLVVASFAVMVLGGLLWPVWSQLVAGK